RSPRRTASTAAALMIGLALVSLVTIFASSAKVSVNKTLDEAISADYILTGPTNSQQGFSPEVVNRVRQQPEVASAAGIRGNVFKLDGKTESVFGIDPTAYAATVRTSTTSGSLADLSEGGLAVRDDVATSHGWKVGDTVRMEFPVGGTQPETIRAVYENNQLNGPYLLPLVEYQRHYADQVDIFALVQARDGVTPDASRAAVERAAAAFPTVQIRDQSEPMQVQAQH